MSATPVPEREYQVHASYLMPYEGSEPIVVGSYVLFSHPNAMSGRFLVTGEHPNGTLVIIGPVALAPDFDPHIDYPERYTHGPR